MPDLSIIIVNYNTKDDTVNCIESVIAKTQELDYEIIVVDNASEDGSVETIKNKFADVKIIKNSKNLGFGKANNIGIEKSNSKYVFLLNPDTVLKNNAVKILYDYMEKHPNVGASGGMLFDANDKRTFSFGKLPIMKDKIALTFLPRVFLGRDIRGKINLNDITNAREVGFICGADLILRRSVIDETGGFDNDFFLYYEETELQYRIKKAGYKICIVPEAEIIHFEGKSLDNIARREESYKSEYMYYKKCYKLTKVSPFKLIFFIYMFPRIFSKPKMILNVVKHILFI